MKISSQWLEGRCFVASNGSGHSVVMDGSGGEAGSLKRGVSPMEMLLMGDMIAEAAARNGWAGAVIYGVIRDSAAIGRMDFGVKALGTNPRKSAKDGRGATDTAVAFGGVVFTPGAWLYSDEDGILVAEQPFQTA